MRISSSKFLLAEPKIMGLTQIEIMALVILSSLVAAISSSGLLTLSLIAGSYLSVLIVSTFLGTDFVVSFLRRILPDRKKKENKINLENLVVFQVKSQFDYSHFDQLVSYHNRFRGSFHNKPEGFQFSIYFRKREFKNFDLPLEKTESINPIETLRNERRRAYLQNRLWQHNVFLICEKKWLADLLVFSSSCKIQIEQVELNEGFLNFDKYSISSGDAFHSVEDGSVHAYGLKTLPTEFDHADLFQFINSIDAELDFSISLKKMSAKKSIDRISFKQRRIAGFSGGDAKGEIEESLSIDAIQKTLLSLISGDESILNIQGTLAVHSSNNSFELPFGALSASFKKMKHLSTEELREFCLGKQDSFFSISMTALEASAVTPLFPHSYESKEFPNFFTPCGSPVKISGLRESFLPNGNAVVFAPSGKGKSFLICNLISSRLEETSLNAIILDSGYGFQTFTQAYGGKVVEMSSDSRPLGVNVLKLFESFENPTYRAELLAEFTRFLIDKKGEISQTDLAKLRQAALLCDFSGGLAGWKKTLEENGLRNWSDLLAPWMKGGIYGDHFDQTSNEHLLSERLIYFTAPPVNNNTENPLMIPYFFLVTLIVAARTSQKSQSRSILVWDEVGFLMQHAPNVVSSLWNCIRKTGSSVICCAQHPAQLTKYGSCGKDILENSPTRYLLGYSACEEFDQILDLTSAQKEFLRDRKPGEYFLLSQEEKKSFLNCPQSPIHYALFTTEKSEREEFENIFNEDESIHLSNQQKLIETAKVWAKRNLFKFGQAVAVLCLVMSSFSASAMGGGPGESVILSEILLKNIQQVLLLTDQLNLQKSNLENFQKVYEGNRQLFNDIKKNLQLIKKGGLKDWSGKIKNLEDVLRIIDEIAAQKESQNGMVIGGAVTIQNSVELQKKLFLESEELRAFAKGTENPALYKGAGIQELTAHMALGQSQILKSLNSIGDSSREMLNFKTREESESLAKQSTFDSLNDGLGSLLGSGSKAAPIREVRPY